MTPAEAAAVLSKCAAFDNRTPTESAARAWAEAVDSNVTLTDALAIVADHYARESRWIMPADINGASKRIRRARLDVMKTPEPPAALDPEDVDGWRVWSRAYRSAIGDGRSERQASEIACAAVGIPVPEEITTVRPVAHLITQAANALPRIPRRDTTPNPTARQETTS